MRCFCAVSAHVCSHSDELSQQLTEALTSLEPARQVCRLCQLFFYSITFSSFVL